MHRCSVHVDANGTSMAADLAIDTEFTGRLVEGTREMGLTAKGVDYDAGTVNVRQNRRLHRTAIDGETDPCKKAHTMD